MTFWELFVADEARAEAEWARAAQIASAACNAPHWKPKKATTALDFNPFKDVYRKAKARRGPTESELGALEKGFKAWQGNQAR